MIAYPNPWCALALALLSDYRAFVTTLFLDFDHCAFCGWRVLVPFSFEVCDWEGRILCGRGDDN